MALKDERELVRRMLEGAEEAFEEFFKIYFPALFRFAFLRLRVEASAEEVVQRTLCQAITKLASYRGEAALLTWLCTFCRHEISAYLKKESHFYLTDFIQETPEVLAALESLLTSQQRPDQIALRKEISQMVHASLEALPFHYSNALRWKYIENIPVKEIAERMNLGFKATESLLTRARQAFQDTFLTLTSA
jgi:RNA polymerase sigma-70 factor (ECF subfamily)